VDKTSDPAPKRRRKQNRLAQQAFRARQKVRVEALEAEWAQLRHLHEGLTQACQERSREIQQLQARVETLLQDIEFLKSSHEIERGWPNSPTNSSSASSWNSSPRQQYTQAQMYPANNADVKECFSQGRFPPFPLQAQYYQQW
jgi:hypothetical protein